MLNGLNRLWIQVLIPLPLYVLCAIMMEDAMKVKGQEENMKVLDVAEIVAKGIE